MRTQNRISDKHKEVVVKEYLRGNISYINLAKKHGVSSAVIFRWVRQKLNSDLSKPSKKESVKPEKQEQLPTDIKQLQEQLRLARLENELLNTIIDIAEEQLDIDIRKKSGTKQSRQ
jgi:transposase